MCLLVQPGGVDIKGHAALIDLQEKVYLFRDILKTNLFELKIFVSIHTNAWSSG